MVPRGWDIGPTILMGPSPWPSWIARSNGHLHKEPHTHAHTHTHTYTHRQTDRQTWSSLVLKRIFSRSLDRAWPRVCGDPRCGFGREIWSWNSSDRNCKLCRRPRRLRSPRTPGLWCDLKNKENLEQFFDVLSFSGNLWSFSPSKKFEQFSTCSLFGETFSTSKKLTYHLSWPYLTWSSRGTEQESGAAAVPLLRRSPPQNCPPWFDWKKMQNFNFKFKYAERKLQRRVFFNVLARAKLELGRKLWSKVRA